MTKTWSLLSIDDGDRQLRGNDGYDDVFGDQYSFDQFVPNHRRVQFEHVGVIRDTFVSWDSGLSSLLRNR